MQKSIFLSLAMFSSFAVAQNNTSNTAQEKQVSVAEMKQKDTCYFYKNDRRI